MLITKLLYHSEVKLSLKTQFLSLLKYIGATLCMSYNSDKMQFEFLCSLDCCIYLKWVEDNTMLSLSPSAKANICSKIDILKKHKNLGQTDYNSIENLIPEHRN